MAREPILERAVLEVLWDAEKPLIPAEVRDRLPAERRGAYTTVMTVLVRLWKKGILKRRRVGRAFEYQPRLGRESYTALRMERMLETAGNRSSTLSRFVEALSESEREHLRRMLGDDL